MSYEERAAKREARRRHLLELEKIPPPWEGPPLTAMEEAARIREIRRLEREEIKNAGIGEAEILGRETWMAQVACCELPLVPKELKEFIEPPKPTSPQFAVADVKPLSPRQHMALMQIFETTPEFQPLYDPRGKVEVKPEVEPIRAPTGEIERVRMKCSTKTFQTGPSHADSKEEAETEFKRHFRKPRCDVIDVYNEPR